MWQLCVQVKTFSVLQFSIKQISACLNVKNQSRCALVIQFTTTTITITTTTITVLLLLHVLLLNSTTTITNNNNNNNKNKNNALLVKHYTH